MIETLDSEKHPVYPMISVLMPVYNVERYVAEATESILTQTYRNFEFLIIDDGSNDGSLAILERYAAQDPRIRLFSRPNTGIVEALNEGLAEAKGKYIARMDADDVSLPDRLEIQCQYLDTHPQCLAVGCMALIIDPVGDPLTTWVLPTCHDEIDAAHLRGDQKIIHPALLVRKSSVVAIGGYRRFAETCEDLDLFIRLGELGELANTPQTLLKFRRRLDSITHTRQAEHSIALANVMDDACQRRGVECSFRRSEPTEPKGRARSSNEHRRSWAWIALAAGYKATARKLAFQSFLRAPLSIDTLRLLYCVLRGY